MNSTLSKFTASFNPATGEKIGESHLNIREDFLAALQKARQVQPAWTALPVKQRIKFIRKIQTFLIANIQRLAGTISLDNGKLRIDALATEILPACMALNYYSRQAQRFLKPRKVASGNWLLAYKRSKIYRVPYGVIGIISPWNYPFGIPFSEIIMALLAGNAVIIKTASDTQQVGRILEECIQSAGLPDGIFHYLNLPGKEAGDAFLEYGVDKLFFTGSVEVGKYIMQKASATLTPVVLELGGKDAMIICQDADLSRCIGGAIWAGFSNAGQSCAAVERIYVHSAVYDQFLEMLKTAVEAIRVGVDDNFDTDMGAITTRQNYEKIQHHIRDAVDKGATIYARSQCPSEAPGLFLPAVVLTNVNHDMLIMCEETFGPVLAVMKYDTEEEAIRLANDSNLGLTASVWSRNRRHALKIARQLQVGSVMINDHMMSHGLAETPWGGFKESGIGRTHGQIGFNEMTQPQVIVNDILPFAKKNLWWLPYSRKVYDGLVGLLNFLYAQNFCLRIGGLVKLLKIVSRYYQKR
jgi:acyl-CoA reductase-like NAD-dependent aldehyde dehydrogenase